MKLRELGSEDIEGVARLFLQTFRPSRRAGDVASSPPPSLIAYLDGLFLGHKLANAATPSWVSFADDGTLNGFIGVLPLGMTIADRTVLAAICTTLMVRSPDKNPMAAAQLMRRVLRGSQDLTMGDTAIHGAQTMWEKLGGHALPIHSLGWTRVLRPAGYVFDRLGFHISSLSKALDPLSDRIWRTAAGAGDRPGLDIDDGSTGSDADLETLTRVLPALDRSYDLRPDWTNGSLAWMVEQAMLREADGPLFKRIVSGKDSRPIGAYLYYGRPGHTANVLHISAPARGVEATLANLYRHARDKGMVAVKGGAQPVMMSELFRHQCFFRYRGATVYHSKDADVLDAIRRDSAVIGGLVGERWTKLDSDRFT